MVIKELFSDLNDKINAFFAFLIGKLSDFKNLVLGEQIAFCCIGIGLILILVSIVLFLT